MFEITLLLQVIIANICLQWSSEKNEINFVENCYSVNFLQFVSSIFRAKSKKKNRITISRIHQIPTKLSPESIHEQTFHLKSCTNIHRKQIKTNHC